MSQENSTSEKTQETRKKLALGGLLVVFVGVMYFQFFSGSSAPAPAPKPPSARAASSPSPTPSRQTPQRSGTPEPIISQPLDLATMQARNNQGSGTGRNIFVYPTPTPVPPPPPVSPTPTPTPLPIQVFSVNPGGVIARTGDFTLTVFGEKIPQDAQGSIDGRTYPTTFVGSNQIKIKVPAEAIRNPGNLGVMVRSQSNARIYSNQTSLNVAAPPEPPYKYIGQIFKKSEKTAVLKSTNNDEDINVKIGAPFGGRWKVVNITPQKIDIEDTEYKILHVINYSGNNAP